jgi:GWxTD domain-containing protein
MKLNNKSAIIDTLGNIQVRFAAPSYGYWTGERFADMLPLEYVPVTGKQQDENRQPDVPETQPELSGVKQERQLYKTISEDPEFIKLKIESETSINKVGALNKLGYLHIQYDHYDSARIMFRRSLKFKPEQADAHNGLGLAFFREGIGENILTAAIEKLIGFDNYSNAEKEFKKALKFDPEFNITRIHLAELYSIRGGKNNLIKAKNTLLDLIEKDNLYHEAYYELGKGELELREYDNAKESFLTQLELIPEHAPSMVYLGMCYNNLNEPEKATDFFLTGLSGLTDKESLDDIYTSTFPLLTDSEESEYKSLSIKERGKYLSNYWSLKDPDLITKVNERLIEPLIRVTYVKRKYNTTDNWKYDERGKIYLKYGEPDLKYTDPAPQRSDPNESWVYNNIYRSQISFDFSTKGGAYRIIPNLSYALPIGDRGYFQSGNPGAIARSLPELRKLYSDRSDLGPEYAKMAMSLRGRKQISDLLSELREISTEISALQNAAPPQSFSFKPELETFDFPFIPAQFSSTDSTSLLEIDFAVPYENLYNPLTGDSSSTTIVKQIVITDSSGSRIYDQKTAAEADTDKLLNKRSQFLFGREIFNLKPGYYNFGIDIYAENLNRRGHYQFGLPVRNFENKELAISDIRLLWPDDAVKITPSSMRSDLRQTRPYPFLSVERNKPLNLYFEIYNLHYGDNNQTSYSITYSIKQKGSAKQNRITKMFKSIKGVFAGKDKSEITVQHELRGSNSDSHETIQLNIEKLPPGDAEITITIFDKLSGKSASVSRPVKIV